MKTPGPEPATPAGSIDDVFYLLVRIADEYGRRRAHANADVNDALSDAFDYFLFKRPDSTADPRAVFFMCLRRAAAKRLRTLDLGFSRTMDPQCPAPVLSL
jgi:hypothetical protein